MKRNIYKILLCSILLLFGSLSVVVCTGNDTKKKDELKNISHYTCPMHPQIHEDKPGECPICHMRLVPVYKEEPAENREHTGRESGFSISTERQQLIGIKTQKARRESVTKKIRTVGRVAFDPDLAVAQKEYLEIIAHSPTLKASAQTRLKLLGMSDAEIQALENRKKENKNLYLPSGETYWVYATIYQEEIPLVKLGSHASIFFNTEKEKHTEGIVRSIDPTLDPMSRSVRARIEVKDTQKLLKPDMFVNVELAIPLGDVIVVPKSAVVSTGARDIVFVSHDKTHFETREIEVGQSLENSIVVHKGIEEGEEVVSYGTFLIDSESELKSAISVSSHGGSHDSKNH